MAGRAGAGGAVCGMLLQYPATDGSVIDYTATIAKAKASVLKWVEIVRASCRAAMKEDEKKAQARAQERCARPLAQRLVSRRAVFSRC